MTLLNAILGFGALAFSVPLLIHLLTRSRYQQLDWGAMHLLESAVATNQRRTRIEQLLLLLIRCAIPILLAFCMARPVLNYLQSMSVDAPRSVAILLDNSLSMQAPGGEGTRMEQARKVVREILSQLPQGSDATVATIGGRVIPLTDQPTTNRRRLSQQVAQVVADGGSVKVTTALEAGMTYFPRMSHPRRQLILVSDFQQADWKGIASTHLSNFADQIKALPLPTEMIFLPQTTEVPNQDKSADKIVSNNIEPSKVAADTVVIESIQQVQRLVTVDQQVEFQVVIRRKGALPGSRIELTPHIDRLPQTALPVELSTAETTQIPWRCRFAEPGSHVVEFVVADATKTMGNRRSLAINVAPRGRVLLVDGDRREGPLQSETDYLALALAPYALGGVTRADPFITETATTNELNERRLQNQQILVLANVSRLTDDQLRLTRLFAERSGLVVVCCGDKVNADWYNRKLFARLGIRLTERRGDPNEPTVANRVSRASFAQGLSSEFGLLTHEFPSDIEASIRCWWRLELVPESGLEVPTPNVLARFENGDPWWCQVAMPPRATHKHGTVPDELATDDGTAGAILISTIPCDADWSDFPAQPFFLPLIQRLLGQQIFRSRSSRNLSTGETVRESFEAQLSERGRSDSENQTPESRGTESRGMTDVEVIWTNAEGSASTITLPVSSQPGVFEKAIDHPGVYQLRVNTTTLDGKSTPQDFFYAVNTPASEFDLRSLAEEEIAEIAQQVGAKVCNSTNDLQRIVQGTGAGRELTHWLWWGVLGLLLFEPWYAQWIARGDGG
jgi:hypothetical protein